MNLAIRSLPLREIIITGVLVVVIGNVIFLDFRTATFINQQSNPSIVYTNVPPQTGNPTPISENTPCATCPAQINMAMSLIKNIQTALTVTPAPTSFILPPSSTPTIATPTPTVSGSSSYVKEYYIPMGSGTGQSGAWADVGGTQTAINTSLYPPIKQVTLQVVGYTPTGNQTVSVQLYDDTNSHAISGSQLTWSGGGTQSLTTGPLTLDSGNNVYSIQMMTQLQYTTNINSATLHIVLY